jgi:large subunit ribosomal protein L3
MAVHGILGRKIGMTQIFRADGEAVPVTVVKAGPCLVVQKKDAEKDGYVAIQLGLVEARPDRRAGKAARGRFDKAGVAPMRTLGEVRLDAGDEIKLGDKVLCDTFQEKDHVDVIGISKGKGFAGVVRRHHFSGGGATHGSMFHRAPGSIGASSYPSRVVKGMRAGGRMGGDRVTVRNLKVVSVDADNNLLIIRGAIPGAPGGYVVVRKAIAAKPEPQVQVEKAGKVTVAKKAKK